MPCCLALADERLGEKAVLREGEVGHVARKELHGDVGGAGVEVALHALDDHVDVAPGDDGVHEPVASPVVQVAFGEALAHEAVAVVGLREVAGASRSMSTFWSGARILPAPRMAAARAVCSAVVRYG